LVETFPIIISIGTKVQTTKVPYWQSCGTDMLIPDPEFNIFYPASRIPDPDSGSASNNSRIFHPKS
jgi:hypothetical protein